MKLTKLVVDLSKPIGEQKTILELTPEEIAEYELLAAQSLADQVEAESKARERLLLIESLGLTEEQIALLGL